MLEVLRIQPICIDNKQVRKRVAKAKEHNVKVVPTMLLVYPDGGFQRMEGRTAAARWIDSELAKHFKPPERPKPPMVVINDPPPGAREIEELPPPPVRRRKEKKPPQLPRAIKKGRLRPVIEDTYEDEDEETDEDISGLGTAIGDLSSEEDEEEDEDEAGPIRRRPVEIRSGPGNYEQIELPEGDDIVSRDASHQAQATIAEREKKNNMRVRAERMQKEREADEKLQKRRQRPPNMPNDFPTGD